MLNVGDLTTMLANGNVSIEASGEPVDIDIQAAFSWSSASLLTLDSYHSVNVGQPVAATGNGGLSIGTNDGGSGGWLTFAPNANVEFSNLSSSLSINGASYTLVGDIHTLASDIAANASGNYALANDYDAKPDGTYSAAPVSTQFEGNFQGLGNVISNLSISGGINKGDLGDVGLFYQAEAGSVISNVVITGASIETKQGAAGILVSSTLGTLFGDHASGAVSVGEDSDAGGLAGVANTVIASSSSASVSAKDGSYAGGLVTGAGTVSECYASGAVTLKKVKEGGDAGGLVAVAENSSISNSYATGKVEETGSAAGVGGLIGTTNNENPVITASYSIGKVSGALTYKGGFIGLFNSAVASDDYWDTQTSGTSNASGNDRTIPGVTGVTTSQLKSGLASGFDPTIWAQSKAINKGFPYLIANPPQ
ncbi:MAG: GLUG motif-containing protein [Rhizomicrobium sp.]